MAIVGLVALVAVPVAIRLSTGSMRDRTDPVAGPSSTQGATAPAGTAGRQPDPNQAERAVIHEHGVPLPVTRAGGPQDTTAGRSRGFVHGTLGAVQAAVHLVVRSDPATGPAVFEPTIREQVVGPFATATLAAVHAAYETQRATEGGAPGAPLTTPLAVRFLGYVVRDEQPNAVTIDLVASDADGISNVRVLGDLHVLWGGDDWQLAGPPAGAATWPATPVAAPPTGYTPFATG